MQYTKFRIQNFKGIKDTTVKLDSRGGAGVFAFVGLNESGKTTILEAIHSFSPDAATSELLGGDERSGVPIKDRVPRHLLSNFTGEISVTATVKLSGMDKYGIIDTLKTHHGITLENNSIPTEISFKTTQKFSSGDFQTNDFYLIEKFKIKSGKKRSFKSAAIEEAQIILDTFYSYTPDIAYFPTFVFDFPKRIFLTKERGGIVNKFYRQVFQDILDFDGQGHTIEDSIVRRVRSEERTIPWLQFFPVWNTHNDKDKIQHVMDRASSFVTEVVFGRWNEIFKEDVKGKEIVISYETIEGETKDENGAITKTNSHDVYVEFKIRDGTRRFRVNDRSLGFRWFFSFMLFTQFRVARDGTRPILFLFDEPASNLHAAAQQKLIDCFPEIAKGEHMLAYSTHSHYMIEPKWLEQTFIVTNRSDAPDKSVLDSVSLDDESLDIKAESYRQFVNKNPGKTSYFQPVLDRLEVAPSKFDLQKNSIIVEGKSDYYILRYCTQLLGHKDFALIPGLGAGTFGALVALSIGWGLNCAFLLDGDEKGRAERSRYIDEYGLAKNRIGTISEFASDVNVIEDLLDEGALCEISKALDLEERPTKNQIRRFFQERLASNKLLALSDKFEKKAKLLIEELESQFEKLG